MKAIFVVLLSFATSTLCAQKIHLFLLGDPSYKHGAKDRAEMENFWKHTSTYLDYTVVTKLSTNKSQLLDHIKKTPVVINKDIIVFYYSGLGQAASERVWPIMEVDGNEVPMRDIMEILRPKKAHLTLVVSDCDNQAQPVYLTRLMPRPHPPTLRESSQELYLGNLECKRMFIKIAAASLGQRALRDKNGNSLFLASFLAALKEQMTQTNPRWGLNRSENTVKSVLTEKLETLTSGAQKPRLSIDCPASVDDDDEEDTHEQ